MSLNQFKFLSASQLKYLAAFFMFLDHIHQMFYMHGAPDWLTMIGRLVFPIFLFLAADSFYYTKNRKAYLKRLFLGSLGMVLTSSLIQTWLPNPNVVIANNAFSTFFVTGIFILGWDEMANGFNKRLLGQFLKGLLIFLLPILLTIPVMMAFGSIGSGNTPLIVVKLISILVMITPSILTIEGGFVMAGLGLFFYIFREKRLIQVAGLLVTSALVYLYSGTSGDVQWMMGFAILPMLCYNGQKGKENKWFFYIFYPVHIYGLYLLSTLFF